MIREPRTPLAELTADRLESLYDYIDKLANPPALRNCLVPGCLRQYDSISCMTGQTPPRPEWSGTGWRTLTTGTIFPAGGHICPGHTDLVTGHLPRILELPSGRWSVDCGCGWTPTPQRWHGVLRAQWEQHILTVLGHLPEAPPITDPEHRTPLPDLTPEALEELYDRLWDAEAGYTECREVARACMLAYDALRNTHLNLYAALAALRRTMAMDPRDWAQDRRDAFLWALLVGWHCEQQHDHDDLCGGDAALLEAAAKHQWTNDMQRRIRIFRSALAAIGPNDRTDIEDARAVLNDPDFREEGRCAP